MGCDLSSLKNKDGKDKKKQAANAEGKDNKSKQTLPRNDSHGDVADHDSLQIPVPGESHKNETKESPRADKHSDETVSVDTAARKTSKAPTRSTVDTPARSPTGGARSPAAQEAARASVRTPEEQSQSVTADYARSGSRLPAPGYGVGAATPPPKRPSGVWMYDELVDDGISPSDESSSSSAPQLFRISPTNRAEVEEGSWRWWMDQVRREKLSRDGHSRERLLDLQNRLVCQHDEEPTRVEVDIAKCYMERTAPYVLGKLFSSPKLREIRWVTSLRLDGNYFTDHGLGNMLAAMSAANERRTVMPLLEELYLNNMNLDRQSLVGILYFLFPVNFKKEKRTPRALGPILMPPTDYAPQTRSPPVVPLFPSLTILSLSDNPSLGSSGVAALLRWMLAAHVEPHILSALDLSRCGIDHAAVDLLEQYFAQLPSAITGSRNPVMPRSLVLLGNPHGVLRESDIRAPDEIRIVL